MSIEIHLTHKPSHASINDGGVGLRGANTAPHHTSKAAELLRPLPRGTSEEIAMSNPTMTPLGEG